MKFSIFTFLLIILAHVKNLAFALNCTKKLKMRDKTLAIDDLNRVKSLRTSLVESNIE